MITKMTRHGDSWALVIEGAMLDQLHINPDTPLEVTTADGALMVRPAGDPDRKAGFETALENANLKYGRVLKKLAE